MSQSEIQAPKGIIVGVDKNAEWLLTWWWKHYRMKNTLPIAFVDFGMTAAAKRWCSEQGTLIPYHQPLIPASKEQVNPQLANLWEFLHSSVELWKSRQAWFQKPGALMRTPFEKTLWVDLDCEIFDSLEPLFQEYSDCEVGMVSETAESIEAQVKLGLIEPSQKVYNAGVILYRRSSPLIKSWSEQVQNKSAEYMGDQEVFARMIFEEEKKITELPKKYNWRLSDGYNPEAVILHWTGIFGKKQLRLRQLKP